jgi:eukaryotic-like serine/threonine-protein kinase
VDRYQLGEPLGRGGMAEVRRGLDLRLDRKVAVKRLRTELAADPAFQERFRREAHAVAILNHPGIAAVFDSGEETDPGTGVRVPFIVMELVDGTTLRSILQDSGALPVRRALEITNVVLHALAHSHASGIVHRDIKPANIMVTANGDIKVMDFGIARAATETTSGLTGTSMVVGTAQYLSPEQAQGASVDLRSDLYSVGCLLYELLTGRPPFLGETAVSLAYQHVREVPEPPSRLVPELGPDIDALLGKALAKEPAERYQSATEMAADIDRILQGRPVLAAAPGESAVDTHEVPVVYVPPPVEEVEVEATRSLPAAAASTTAAASVAAPTAVGSSVAPPAATTADTLAPAPEPRRSAGRTVAIAALTLLVLGGLLFGAYWLLAPGGERRVSVPSLQGSTRAEAEAQLREAGLQAAFIHRRGPDDNTRGTVVRQSPGPDAEVEQGSTVTAEINVGPATTKIPDDLVGHDLDEALEVLADAGFTNVKAVPVDNPPEDAEPDEVVAVEPAEGKRAALEEDIVVSYVGRAAEPATSGPTVGGAPTTKNRPPTDKESDESNPAEEPTRSSSPDDDETSTRPPTATRSSEPTETATTEPSAPAGSTEPSGEASGDTNPAEGEVGTPIPNVSEVQIPGDELPAGGQRPAGVESINP